MDSLGLTLDGELVLSDGIPNAPELSYDSTIIVDDLNLIAVVNSVPAPPVVPVEYPLQPRPTFNTADRSVKGSLGKISGQLLSSNLQRHDDLSFDHLLYLDVDNRRVGISSSLPNKTLVVTDLYATNVITKQATIGNLFVSNSRIQNIFNSLVITANQVTVNNLMIGTNLFKANSITNPVTVVSEAICTDSVQVDTLRYITNERYNGPVELDFTNNTINVSGVFTINSPVVKFSNVAIPVSNTSVEEPGMMRYNPDTKYIEVYDTNWVPSVIQHPTITEQEAADIMQLWSIILS